MLRKSKDIPQGCLDIFKRPLRGIAQCLFSFFVIFYFPLFSEERGFSVEHSPELRGLEKEFPDVFSGHLDLKSSTKKAYLEPNERGVIQAQPFLKLEEPGLLVSVGSERSFFDLIVCAQISGDNCLGLVVRDVHPKIKAYIDYAVMLLRISRDCAEFEELASSSLKKGEAGYEQFRINKIKDIRDRIVKGKLPSILQNYYQRNLEDFFTIYHEESRRFWLIGSSEGLINYHKEKENFSILQSYAIQGNIIASLGDVNDLEFLSNRTLGVIDVSNIPSFAMIDFCSHHQVFHPRVIWTAFEKSIGVSLKTNYFSFVYTKLSEEEREEVDEMLLLLAASYTHRWKKFHYTMISSSVKKILLIDDLGCFPSYSKQFLSVLRLLNISMRKK